MNFVHALQSLHCFSSRWYKIDLSTTTGGFGCLKHPLCPCEGSARNLSTVFNPVISVPLLGEKTRAGTTVYSMYQYTRPGGKRQGRERKREGQIETMETFGHRERLQ